MVYHALQIGDKCGEAEMLHDLRRSKRYALAGTATLYSGGQTITGLVVDISAGGVALQVEPENCPIVPSFRKTWLCRIDSPDLPAPLEFLVKVVRRANWREGSGIGCTITAINERDALVLKAYRALAIARANPGRLRGGEIGSRF